MSKKVKKSLFLFFSVVMVMGIVLAINFKSTKKVSKASAITKTGYFNTYSDVTNIEYDKNYTSAQAMSTYDGKVWHIKIANDGTAKAGKSRIWAYDVANKKNIVIYNGKGSNYVFEIGHANCMYVGKNSLYIATQEDGKPSIARFSIGTVSGKTYLYDRKNFKLYSHNTKVTTPIGVTGINYASELGGFVVKSGNHIYLGNFSGDKFNWTKHYVIDTYLTVKTNDGKTENINVASYIKQGMFYRSGILYMPMVNDKKLNQSIVVAYKLDTAVANNAVLQEKSDLFFRITSSKYSKLFEIEDVARHNNSLYCNANITDSYGKTHDKIIVFKNFTF